MKDSPYASGMKTARWQAYVEAGADLYVYDGRFPHNLLVIDDAEEKPNRQPKAAAGIERTNPVVRSWAPDTIEKYRSDAKLLDFTVFAAATSTDES